MTGPLNRSFGRNERGGRVHEEWHAPCGCAYHPDPMPHIHPCADHVGDPRNAAALGDAAAGVIGEVALEVVQARRKFPEPNANMTALTEKVGELAKALLDEPAHRVREEAVQVAAVAIRVAVDGDATLDGIRRRRGAEDKGEEATT